MNRRADLRVLVAGAGIGGLATALSLASVRITGVRLMEAVSLLRPLGVGINLLPHAVRELDALGLADDLAETGIEVHRSLFFDRHGNMIRSLPRGLAAGYHWPQYFMHRGQLQMVLLNAVVHELGDEAITTGCRVSNVKQEDGVAIALIERLGTDDAVEVPADVVIGADGINSTVRSILHPLETGPVWNGCMMWRGTSPMDFWPFDPHTLLMAGHATQRFVAYPIRAPDGELLLNWVCVKTVDGAHTLATDWNRQVDPTGIATAFHSWRISGLDVPQTVAVAPAVYLYPMVDRDPLPRWGVGRITLLGDAAHPMYPIGANGASQAILDARLLAAELARDRGVEHALAAYEEQRRPDTGRVILANRSMADARLLQLVHDRAPDGFSDISDVISVQEMDDLIKSYQRIAGFEPSTLNARESHDPTGP